MGSEVSIHISHLINFIIRKASVESEIAGHSTKKHQRPQARPEASTETAANKQIQFLLKLGKGCNKGLPELNAMAQS